MQHTRTTSPRFRKDVSYTNISLKQMRTCAAYTMSCHLSDRIECRSNVGHEHLTMTHYKATFSRVCVDLGNGKCD